MSKRMFFSTTMLSDVTARVSDGTVTLGDGGGGSNVAEPGRLAVLGMALQAEGAGVPVG